MAKKKHRFTAKRVIPKAKKAPPKKAARRAPTKNGAHSVALPGMGQLRNTRLDNYCESLGRTRQRQATLRLDEQGDLQGALTEMHKKGVKTYIHAGVELVRVTGAEKIRARLIDESRATTANNATEESPSDAPDDTGSSDGEDLIEDRV